MSNLKEVFKSMKYDHLLQSLDSVLDKHSKVHTNLSSGDLAMDILERKEAVALPCGALATWTPAHSTGRSPGDTYFVQHEESSKNFDWNSPNANALSVELFDSLWADAVATIKNTPQVFISERVVGADSSYALPTRVVASEALTILFTHNMFRPIPDDISNSVFAGDSFTLLATPKVPVNSEKYKGKLRQVNGETSPLMIAMDMDRKLGLVMGSWYQGCIKKLMFTVMNYLLPEQGILPLHCSANEGTKGDVALFLGLSGTGKTTLSSDASRSLLGDDEHGWSDNGIANFENGCYAKLIDLDPEKEPDIHDATFHQAPVTEHFSIIENAMVYPDGSIDVTDSRLTENSRVSYPLTSLRNIKASSVAGHPSAIVFLTADAHGVLPPVARLGTAQAKLWFLMGYTSKLAGTETGITEPVSAFSRFFGGPFMARNPKDYIDLFGRKIEQHETSVFLINTGWTGGPYGVGKRFDINTTRLIVHAVLSGALNEVEYETDSLFHFDVPKSCPNVDSKILRPENTWQDKAAYGAQAKKLAKQFADHFDKAFSSGVDAAVSAVCPGK